MKGNGQEPSKSTIRRFNKDDSSAQPPAKAIRTRSIKNRNWLFYKSLFEKVNSQNEDIYFINPFWVNWPICCFAKNG